MRLRETWDRAAETWAAFAGSPEGDWFYWAFHRPRFLALLPAPGRLTVDLGCGEGRLTAELARLGHRVVGVEASATLARLAAARGTEHHVAVGDAARVPLPDGAADLVVAFMSLQVPLGHPGRHPQRAPPPGGVHRDPGRRRLPDRDGGRAPPR